MGGYGKKERTLTSDVGGFGKDGGGGERIWRRRERRRGATERERERERERAAGSSGTC